MKPLAALAILPSLAFAQVATVNQPGVIGCDSFWAWDEAADYLASGRPEDFITAIAFGVQLGRCEPIPVGTVVWVKEIDTQSGYLTVEVPHYGVDYSTSILTTNEEYLDYTPQEDIIPSGYTEPETITPETLLEEPTE